TLCTQGARHYTSARPPNHPVGHGGYGPAVRSPAARSTARGRRDMLGLARRPPGSAHDRIAERNVLVASYGRLRGWLAVLAVFVALVAAATYTFLYYLRPTTLTIAVAGPADTADATLFTAISQQLARDRAGIRLRLVFRPGLKESAQAIDA